MFRALHVIEDKLRHKFRAECRRYGISAEERRLHDQIDLDLAALGCRNRSPSVTAFSAGFGEDFAHALGALYVVEGSALGNALLLRQVEAMQEAAYSGAKRFLSITSHRAGAAFQEFRLGLDRFGLDEPAAHEDVIDGARTTFRACGALLDSLA